MIVAMWIFRKSAHKTDMAIVPERTSATFSIRGSAMSAFGGKADIAQTSICPFLTQTDREKLIGAELIQGFGYSGRGATKRNIPHG